MVLFMAQRLLYGIADLPSSRLQAWHLTLYKHYIVNITTATKTSRFLRRHGKHQTRYSATKRQYAFLGAMRQNRAYQLRQRVCLGGWLAGLADCHSRYCIKTFKPILKLAVVRFGHRPPARYTPADRTDYNTLRRSKLARSVTSVKLSCVPETMYIIQLITRWQYYPIGQAMIVLLLLLNRSCAIMHLLLLLASIPGGQGERFSQIWSGGY